MNLETDQLHDLCEMAIHAATAAGYMISETRPLDVRHKTAGDCPASQVLTEVDLASEQLILEILDPTFEEYDLALLTEESPDDGSRLEKDYFWCIDPIDGTLPFVEAVPGYAVAIALISREGIPHIGVVYDPVEHHLYHAIRNEGAFKDEKPWFLPLPNEDIIHLFTDRSFARRPEFPELIKQLESACGLPFKPHTQGGGVMNAIWSLENAPGCYFKFPKSGNQGGGCFWDYAATACIFTELGCVATDIHGDPLELNRTESIYMNHKGNLFATNRILAAAIQDLYAEENA